MRHGSLGEGVWGMLVIPGSQPCGTTLSPCVLPSVSSRRQSSCIPVQRPLCCEWPRLMGDTVVDEERWGSPQDQTTSVSQSRPTYLHPQTPVVVQPHPFCFAEPITSSLQHMVYRSDQHCGTERVWVARLLVNIAWTPDQNLPLLQHQERIRMGS